MEENVSVPAVPPVPAVDPAVRHHYPLAVRQASIGHPNETVLAEKSRDLEATPTRWLTDLIDDERGAERHPPVVSNSRPSQDPPLRQATKKSVATESKKE